MHEGKNCGSLGSPLAADFAERLAGYRSAKRLVGAALGRRARAALRRASRTAEFSIILQYIKSGQLA
jgi:hypothetical protein